MSDNTVRSADDLLALWFSPRVQPLWFNSTAAFDNELREHFLMTYQAALAGELTAWEDHARGALALVICLDQLPLNMFRGQAQAFAGEAQARAVAARAIARGHDRDLTGKEKAFLYMPFMHSEDSADQARSVALYEAAGLQDNLKFARHHQAIVQRFGRFPHRNALLGRESTPEEQDYLESDAAFLG